jgi:polygalacturonase
MPKNQFISSLAADKISLLMNLQIFLRPVVFGLLAVCLSAQGGPPSLPAVATPAIPSTVVRLTECGGIGDGQTLNTAAFEKAFATLAAKGGGRLVVPPGLWLTGPLQFRSRTELHLERGALIQFSRDYRLYPLTVIDLKGEKEVDSTSPLSGQNLEDIAITGEGTLDGNGQDECCAGPTARR